MECSLTTSLNTRSKLAFRIALAGDSREVKMSLVWLLLARLGCFSLTRIRSCALSDLGVEGIGKHASWAAVEAADVVEVARLLEIAFDEPHVAAVIQSVPDLDLCRRHAWRGCAAVS